MIPIICFSPYQVGSASPIEDFLEIIGRKDEDKFEEGESLNQIQTNALVNVRQHLIG